MSDGFPMQHTSGNDNADKFVPLQQIMTLPQFVVATWSGNGGSASCLNYPSFTPVLGQVFNVTFSQAYSNSGNANITINGTTYPIKAHGVQCAKGFCKAGNSFTAMLKTTATTVGETGTLYVDLDTDCVSVDTSTVTQSSGNVIPLNSALENYQKRPIIKHSGNRSIDFNSLTSDAIYYEGTTTYTVVNSPYQSLVGGNYFAGTYNIVDVNKLDDDNICQKLTVIGGASSIQKTWERKKNSGTWGSWVQIY